MNNPTSAAVTHVLHNKRDFPSVNGVEDLLVLSIGNGPLNCGSPKLRHNGDCSTSAVVEIAVDGVSETIDQMIGNALCWNRIDYLRIQTYISKSGGVESVESGYWVKRTDRGSCQGEISPLFNSSFQGSFRSALQIPTVGKYVQGVGRAYKEVLSGSGLAFHVNVPWLCNSSLVVSRNSGILLNRDSALDILASKSMEVDNILNLPFSCFTIFKRRLYSS